MARSCDVAIIGGGLGGLAVAAGLVRRGYNAQIYEAAPALRTATSTLIGLGTNAWAALDSLHPSISPTLQQRGSKSRAIVSVSRERFRAGDVKVVHKPGHDDLYTIRWSEVQRTLAELLPADSIHCSHRASGYTEEQDCVTVHFKDQPDVRAKLVVAADGVRSAMRACMLPNDPGPRYLGHMNWNALFHNPDNSVLQFPEPGELYTVLNGPRYSWTIHGFVIDAGGGYSFWQCRVQSESPAFTPDPQQQHPLAGGNVPADDPLRLSDAAPAHLVGGGLGRPGSKARLIRLLEEEGEAFDKLLQAVKVTPESDIFERAMLDRVPLDELGAHMSSPGGRVVLLGDAAHAMHSGPGQGGRTAFEDAHTLVQALDQHRSQLYGWASAAHKATDHHLPDAVAAILNSAVAALTLNGHPRGHAPDTDALSKVVKQYENARLVRTCRIQRVAAEGCGLESLRNRLKEEAYGPGPVSNETVQERIQEMQRWLNQYPDNPQGDPMSRFWKPPGVRAANPEC